MTDTESTQGHTPGPWRTHQTEASKQWYVETDDAYEDTIASTFGTDAEANARLISAAPEMLEALRGLQVIAEQNVTDLAADVQVGRTPDEIWKMEMARWQAVLTAIEKTEGR